jgi:hypothetical protein
MRRFSGWVVVLQADLVLNGAALAGPPGKGSHHPGPGFKGPAGVGPGHKGVVGYKLVTKNAVMPNPAQAVLAQARLARDFRGWSASRWSKYYGCRCYFNPGDHRWYRLSPEGDGFITCSSTESDLPSTGEGDDDSSSSPTAYTTDAVPMSDVFSVADSRTMSREGRQQDQGRRVRQARRR